MFSGAGPKRSVAFLLLTYVYGTVGRARDGRVCLRVLSVHDASRFAVGSLRILSIHFRTPFLPLCIPMPLSRASYFQARRTLLRDRTSFPRYFRLPQVQS